MQVSIIIVNYKNPPLIVQCVQSILRYEQTVEYEIIVVDNDSHDDTEQQLRAIYPNLKWVQMGYNSGFAKANNAGFSVAEGKFIFYLNSDTIFIEPVFEQMIKEMNSDHSVGILGCQLLNKDRSLQLSYHNGDMFFRKLWWRNPFAIKMGYSRQNQFEMEQCKENHSMEHTSRWICGAAMMMRQSDIVKYNLKWNEDFFMYWEDVELCYRIRKLGKKVYYTPSVAIVHLGGGGESNVPLERFNLMETSKLKCITKIHGGFYCKIYVWLLRCELWLEYYLQRRKNTTINEILKNEIKYYAIKKI